MSANLKKIYNTKIIYYVNTTRKKIKIKLLFSLIMVLKYKYVDGIVDGLKDKANLRNDTWMKLQRFDPNCFYYDFL